VLRALSVSPRRAFLYGRRPRIRFRIDDRSRTVRVRLAVVTAGGRRVLRRIDLGERRTGVRQSHPLAARLGGPLPEGRLELRLSARDSGGRRLRVPRRMSGRRALLFRWHHFPLRGRFGFGGAGSRFGAGRPGHLHQGQDIPAPTGTPVIAPRGGRVRLVSYQAEGAGHYIVLQGAGEDREYVFMHLQSGSIRVRPGQFVRTAQRLASVGSTGVSSGPHLHFEIWWGGPWQAGGRPLDPLPYLRRWARWS
jgi:murein DD-endopeptidase MepM/ murein hydrolase activator NlpD